MANTYIMGRSVATPQQMKKYIQRVNPEVPQSVLDMIPLYLSEGLAEGVRGDIAFAQSCLETGNFTFKGSAVTIYQNNFAGMGVTQNGMKGNSWHTPKLGIRAQIQHLKAYASEDPLVHDCVDFRFDYVRRGCAVYVEWLGIKENPDGYGWASGVGYGNKIIDILNRILREEEHSMKIYLSPSDQTGNGYRTGNTNEAVQCRKIANAASKALKRNGYTVKVGADGTTYQERVADSNTWGADIHVPIHTNATGKPEGGGGGTIVFAYPNSVKNKYVQEVYKAVAELSPGRGGKDYGVQGKTGLYEISHSKGVCVYIECEFHDDATLAKWIIDNVDALGEAICKGFCNADGKKYVAPEKAPETPNNEATGGKLYRVQVGAYSKKENAEAMMDKLKSKGFDAILKYD